jgi:poly(A) polymerase
MKVLGVKPGPIVGKVKDKIKDAILDGEIPNKHEDAYQYLLKIKDEI